MRLLCQLSLLGAFVSLGYAAFAGLAGWRWGQRAAQRSAVAASLVGLTLLTMATALLAVALVVKDFRFAYVAQYSSRLLPWYYSLSALWVGQAGSLLLWSWMTLSLAMIYRWHPIRTPSSLQDPTFCILILLSWFLVTTTAFAADPAAASLAAPREGAGLSPLLQHPAMLIHPPVVFLGYAAWSVPMALAVAAMGTGRLDTTWAREARSWALFAWAMLGAGILLGAAWAYRELGWGGYWGWDPVENGSLIPWLTGTALLHGLMIWQHARLLKKTTLALAIATFGMCSFATFLTRSGVFSSVHAFSQSSVGWLFLALMLTLLVSGIVLVATRWEALRPDSMLSFVLCRETMIAFAMLSLILLAIVICLGTLCTALSTAFLERNIAVGAEFYNHVLIPTGLLLLTVTATAPLLRWGAPPTRRQKQMLWWSAAAALVGMAIGWWLGGQDALQLLVVGLTVFAGTALVAGVLVEARRLEEKHLGLAVYHLLRMGRRKHAGFLAHLGFFGLAIGITWSARGAQEEELRLKVGGMVRALGYSVQLESLMDRQDCDKLVAEACLQVTDPDGRRFALQPARHYHLLQQEWTSEVAVHGTWRGDVYTILHGSGGDDSVHLTLRLNPGMRWFWAGGFIMVAAAALGLTTTRNAQRAASSQDRREPRPCQAGDPSLNFPKRRVTTTTSSCT